MEMLNEIFRFATDRMGDNGGWLLPARQYIEDQFGTPGLIAVGLLIAGIVVLVLSKTLKLSFDVVRYVAIPSVAISFIATCFLPLSFVYILPVTVAFFSIVLMVKG
jgi:hypothetical protein